MKNSQTCSLPAAVKPADICRLQNYPGRERWRRNVCGDRRRSALARSCLRSHGCQAPDALPEKQTWRLQLCSSGHHHHLWTGFQCVLPAEAAQVGSCPPSLWLFETEQFPECNHDSWPPAGPGAEKRTRRTHTHPQEHLYSSAALNPRSPRFYSIYFFLSEFLL